MTLRIGSHPHNLSLFILRQRGVLETALASLGGVAWVDYLHGGDSARLLADDQLDVAGSDATPAILAAGNGLAISWLAASPDRGANCALLAMKEGPYKDVSDLRGARIACLPGTFTDHVIARLLLQQGLQRDDVTLVELNGSDSARALREGRVDLWAAIDPWLTAARDAKKIRCLAQAGELITNRAVFCCRARWPQQHPQLAETLLEELIANDRWIAQHPRQAAELLHTHLPAARPLSQCLNTISTRPWGIQRVNDALLAEQQQQADDLLAAGFIPAVAARRPALV